MAAPNIANVSAIYGKTFYITPTATTSTVLLANSASTNKVLKINQITAANVTNAVQVATTVAVNSNAAGSGTSYSVISAGVVPVNASLLVIDKSTSFYLEEDKSVVVTSGTSAGITYIVSYEEIS